nr:MAG TPA: hypothetical protein [Caudoviricetes sp.]
MIKISYIVIILYICKQKDNYDKGNTCTLDEREEELLLWLNSCDLQRFDG